MEELKAAMGRPDFSARAAPMHKIQAQLLEHARPRPALRQAINHTTQLAMTFLRPSWGLYDADSGHDSCRALSAQ
jgi:hypothetical protein